MNRIYRWGGGRTATFALFFFLAGVLLASFHRLDGYFVSLCSVIVGMLTARAVSDDHKKQRDKWTDEERAAAAAQKGGTT